MKSHSEILEFLNSLPFIKTITSLSSEKNIDSYLVGGIVRDFLLNRGRKDIDIVVTGNGLEFAEEFAKKMGIQNLTVFSRYGTAHMRLGNYEIEFVGARKESYNLESRNPEVMPAEFEEDISRRDFTVNALAISLNERNFGELIDLHGGLNDLKTGVLKTPLEPEKTFNDDPLRMMRACRFASQLNFQIDDSVCEAIKTHSQRINIITKERISVEFVKTIASPKPSVGLIYMFKLGLLKEFFPELNRMGGIDQRNDYHHKDVFYHTCQVVDNISEVTDKIWLRFAALLHDIGKPPTKRFIEGTGWTFHGHEEVGARMLKSIFRKLVLPMNQLPYMEKLVRLHLRPVALSKEEVTDSAIRRLIVDAGEDLDDLIMLCRADITSKNPVKVSNILKNYEVVMERVKDVREKDALRAFQSPVRGDEIMKICNIPPGREVGILKSAIEEAILEGEIGNNYEEALAFLLRIKDNYL
ncbi:MAG: HD domain-containing protein [Ignavibacteriaceae bacterium]|nr:HD domain-containing protein [Ignavibacteriaceae bacterium]